MRWTWIVALGCLLAGTLAWSQAPQSAREFVSVDAPVVVLAHVRVIDGTGGPPTEDQSIVIAQGRIQSVGSAASVKAPANAKVLDLAGHTVIPGLVGMHDHMFYPSGAGQYNEQSFSFPRLYLACGVTSIRTTGSMEPYTDLNLKQAIDAGRVPGPKMHVTGPYLQGQGSPFTQMHALSGPDEARRMVEYWADTGVTSFKAYMHITQDELSAAIAAAHKRGIKVTGHLCSVGFREAAELGIDDLEHGLVVDTEFVPGKTKDVCPAQNVTYSNLAKMDEKGPEIQETIWTLVRKHVAVTSTLAVFEHFVPGRPPLDQRSLDAMSPEARVNFLRNRLRAAESKNSSWPENFKKELQFEYDFAKAGGLLIAGLDPTGGGGVVAGFGDQRDVELLVEAGFTPVEAIRIASANGAQYLGIADQVGTVAAGKQADLVVIQGNPAAKISDIENVRIVFKDGVGYDSAKLITSVRDAVGLH